jgi:hypothetical protein
LKLRKFPPNYVQRIFRRQRTWRLEVHVGIEDFAGKIAFGTAVVGQCFPIVEEHPICRKSKRQSFTQKGKLANHCLQWFQKAFKEEEHICEYVITWGKSLNESNGQDSDVGLITKILKKFYLTLSIRDFPHSLVWTLKKKKKKKIYLFHLNAYVMHLKSQKDGSFLFFFNFWKKKDGLRVSSLGVKYLMLSK